MPKSIQKTPKKTNSFIDWLLLDIFYHLPEVSVRAMFGGYGMYSKGRIFGIIVQNKLYLKVDASNRADYEKAGSKPFQYRKNDGTAVSMSYWQIPDDILEHPEQAQVWAQKSILIPTKHTSKPRQF